MNDKDLIKKLIRYIWACDGCPMCTHRTWIENICGTYPDCELNWCNKGEKFDLNYDEVQKEINLIK
jgi:hypothetical protein